ncbi:hypothetical protein FisN_22Lh202 [Fistulifera solaris]|uniref:Uncharacterized protein n=1 Tax=Fistulifera solaris TaxID=1519565 RepID=A0A1Z5JCM6_FISSO|nr:hypothetical protein FisN_22Lh202 [Fistulifera solaris]|eukprot:GAX11511.1 hypothetical protein FisN_22Lh202 [Fistulifera solaris]
MTLKLSLHDGIALGEIEMGLPTQPTPSAPEMRRLPTLLRILAAARPLSSVPAFDTTKHQENDSHNDDKVLQEAVRRLEQRAAIYSIAEGVEVTAVHLAPAVCRKISKLKPLRTLTRETEDLLLARPKDAGEMEIDDHDDDSLSGDDDVVSAKETTTTTHRQGPRRSSVDPRLTINTQGEDSQEANVVRILAELSSLVVQSLKPPKKDDDELVDWSISLEESLLAEPGSKVDQNVGGAMVSSDLGATVVSLMHHAAVLRHDHVACALCRAAVPQTPSLIARMGANAPASIPTLVRGCIRAYEKASQSRAKNHAIASSARQAIRSLASLSAREASRIRSLLERDGVMIDVQLELAMKHDPLLALCLLTDSLSTEEEMLSSKEQGPGRVKMRTLASHLTENSTFLSSVIAFVVDDLVKLTTAESCQKMLTRLRFAMSALSWVLLRLPADNLLTVIDATKQKLLLGSLIKIREHLPIPIGDAGNYASSPFDRCYSMVLCCSLSFAMVQCSSTMSNESNQQKAVDSLGDTLRAASRSRQCEAHVAELTDSLFYNNPHNLCSDVFRLLSATEVMKPNAPPWFFNSVIGKSIKLCQWFSTNPEHKFSGKATNELQLETQISKTLRFLQQSGAVAKDQLQSDCTRLLITIFTDESLSTSLLLCSAVPEFVRLSIKLLRSENDLMIPLVLPLQVQSLKANFLSAHGYPTLSPQGARFLLMVLYCLEYLEAVPATPFGIDLGTIPMREIYGLCIRNSKQYIMSQAASFTFLRLIGKLAPEVPFWNQVINLKSRKGWALVGKVELRNAIYLGLKERGDVFYTSVEKLFLMATGSLSDADLITTTVNGLLGNKIKPHPHYSYGVLCRDPLLVFKVPFAVLQKSAFRRIVLFVLCRLLEINDGLTQGMMKDNCADAEYISARNCIVLQCLCQSFFTLAVAERCMVSISVIRRLVASQEGLAAIIIKQVSDDLALDYFCDTIPEAINDWRAYLYILAERSSMPSVDLLSHKNLYVLS